VIVEFVSAGRRDRVRDYETKRDEYMAIGVREYWVIDRFEHNMTVFSRSTGKIKRRVIRANQVYQSPLLPGFELPLARLFALADRWPAEEATTDS
jgi:Uma2 family endonuclease